MSPALPVLIDSDVLIWLTRGHVGAAQRLGQISTWRISVVTYMELAQGCRNKAELAWLKKGWLRATPMCFKSRRPFRSVRQNWSIRSPCHMECGWPMRSSEPRRSCMVPR